MKESYGEGVATHTSPESCIGDREGAGEALTGESAGRVLSREMSVPSRERWEIRGADAMAKSGRPHRERRERETLRNPARSQTPRMHGRILHGNREIPPSSAHGGADRIGKSEDTRR